MIEYREVQIPDERASICDDVLHALPEWFGIEESTADYIRQARELPFYAAYDNGKAVGFATVKTHTAYAAEVCVTGILPGYHRQGIGRKLIALCEDYCKENHFEYLTVKTVDDSAGHECYAKTVRFYLAVGFVPLEVFPLLWDESNPCLLMIKRVGTGKR